MAAAIGGIFGIIGIIVTYKLEDKNRHKYKTGVTNPLEHTETNIKLIYHPIFTRLRALKVFIKNGLTIKNEAKRLLFKDILSHKLNIWQEVLLELGDDMDKCRKSCDRRPDDCNLLYNANMIALNKAMDKFNTFYLREDYTEEEREVLRYVMDKFNNWNYHRIEYLTQAITLTCNSHFYEGCKTRQAVIFDIYIGSFADTVNDAEHTLQAINGELRGKTYKGRPF